MTTPRQPKPTKAELQALTGGMTSDLIAPNLHILFCGINPGLYSVYTGHHFARPGNRFWPTLYAAGFTERLLTPGEEQEILAYGYGITNLVERATASAAELSSSELVAGAHRLIATVQRYQPKVVAILGVSAYRTAFARPHAVIGRQNDPIGPAILWILPNPSGLNAHYTPTGLAQVFRDFRMALKES